MYQDILLKQLAAFRHNTLSVVEGVTEEMADIVPEGFNNNIRWQLGHIYLDQYDWLYHKINEDSPVPKHYRELFGYGTRPSDWKLSPPTLDELKNRLADQVDHIKEHFGRRLDEELESPAELGMNTFAEILPRTFYHEGMHTGHIIALKKAMNAEQHASL
ncbi:DinB family protein [Fictibacillus aquaticus]|uniref:DinB family protein n=1 Tax=Fictibacillus aquaticus TaxID=2021314 RepID=UPI0013FD96C2|nr:DinB family protein [Fictibacillus aquaticus]